jgi:hypothetical protein
MSDGIAVSSLIFLRVSFEFDCVRFVQAISGTKLVQPKAAAESVVRTVANA